MVRYGFGIPQDTVRIQRKKKGIQLSRISKKIENEGNPASPTTHNPTPCSLPNPFPFASITQIQRRRKKNIENRRETKKKAAYLHRCHHSGLPSPLSATIIYKDLLSSTIIVAYPLLPLLIFLSLSRVERKSFFIFSLSRVSHSNFLSFIFSSPVHHHLCHVGMFPTPNSDEASITCLLQSHSYFISHSPTLIS